MKKKIYLYAGETLMLRFLARHDGLPLDMSHYDVTVELVTTSMGAVITKRSEDDSLDLSQAQQGILTCRFEAEETRSLTPGRATVGMTLEKNGAVLMGATTGVDILRRLAAPAPCNSRSVTCADIVCDKDVDIEMQFAAVPGKDADIIGVTASIDENVGIPKVAVTLGGEPQERTLDFLFENLKGETPKISADEEGNIYSDGEFVTAVVAEVVVKADTASANADQQAARAKSLADHPPKIVDVGGLKYWAFWDEATKGYVTSEYRAEGGAIMPVFWVDPATLKLYVTYQNGYEGAKFKLENGKLYTIKTVNQ